MVESFQISMKGYMGLQVIKHLNTVSAFILVKQPTEHINNYNFFESSTKFILTSFVTIRPGLTVIKLQVLLLSNFRV